MLSREALGEYQVCGMGCWGARGERSPGGGAKDGESAVPYLGELPAL